MKVSVFGDLLLLTLMACSSMQTISGGLYPMIVPTLRHSAQFGLSTSQQLKSAGPSLC
jgi:hypothetical protein